MKIVIAPQAFKGGLSVLGVCEAIREGILDILPEAQVIKIPMADGGDGTLDALVSSSGGELFKSKVLGPLGLPITALWGAIGKNMYAGTEASKFKGRIAIIEMAQSSGLALIPDSLRNPMLTTSYGTGELIRQALDNGFRRIIIGLGGSATNDGGMGMAQALGIRFLDGNGCDLLFGGGSLSQLDTFDISGLHPAVNESCITAAADVYNPICGENGASLVYGPQKGATPDMARELDKNLRHMSEKIRHDLDIDICGIPRMGAGGGLAASLMAFVGGKIESGIDLVARLVGLENKLTGADLVFTAEGKIDNSTIYGKLPIGIARLASAKGIPVIALTGSLGEGYEGVYGHGINEVVPISDRPMSLDVSLEESYNLLRRATARVINVLRLGGFILPPAVL